MFRLRHTLPVVLSCLAWLLLGACQPRNSYGIPGTWSISITHPNQEEPTVRIREFRGDQVRGTVWTEQGEQIGTYQMTGTEILFTQSWIEPVYHFSITEIFTGSFETPDTMAGTMEQNYLDRTFTATWNGLRR